MQQTNFTPVVIKGNAALSAPLFASASFRKAPAAAFQGRGSMVSPARFEAGQGAVGTGSASCAQAPEHPCLQPAERMVLRADELPVGPSCDVPKMLAYTPCVKRRMTILICETLSMFANVRKLMKNQGQRRFFGTRVDGVAYGTKEALLCPGSLLELERSLGDEDGVCFTPLGGAFRPQVSYLYWGSISRPAVMDLLSLYRANPGWQVKPFMPAYRYMLDTAYGRRLPSAPDTPESSFLLRLEAHLTPMQQSTYRQVLAGQQCIPQGIVTERVLRKMARRPC